MNRTLWPTELCRHIETLSLQRYTILTADYDLVNNLFHADYPADYPDKLSWISTPKRDK